MGAAAGWGAPPAVLLLPLPLRGDDARHGRFSFPPRLACGPGRRRRRGGGAAGFSHPAPPGRAEPVPILPLTSTSEVFTPSHGRAFMRLSFAFPEPSVEFEGYRFGFLVFTRENVYGLDAGRMTAARTPSGLEISATGLVWAGGQQAAPGRVIAQLQKHGDFIEWDVTAEMGQPVKA